MTHLNLKHNVAKEKDKVKVAQKKKQVFPCDVEGCGASFSWPIGNLKRHQRAAHSGQPGWVCPQCGKGFSQRRTNTMKKKIGKDA